MQSVSVVEQTISIPTYGVGQPDKNPQFIENRVYQGSSGKVYPYPVIETLDERRTDREYQAVVLENDYLKVTVLPEFGGRIQWALDKTNGYDFVYHNDVIKPALVGLLGPWISGGIEFNWPQHHRPTTFMPVDYRIMHDSDGAGSVQCHDTDRISGTESVTTITLYPGKAYIAISADVYNSTALPKSFLWWANPAVPVNDRTKTVMPPDVTAVMDHGKRDVSRYPIATGIYYKHDYSQGVDIGRYKNVPVPTSYMAAKSDFDFVGGYDYGRQAGIVHVADHHIAPGKKQWTWGNGDFGQAWDRNLTDDNGPYVELMTGVYTDNQPDFTWLKPGESKKFTQFFMPYKDVGQIKNATTDAMVNLEVGPADQQGLAREEVGVEAQGLEEGQIRVSVYGTQVFDPALVRVATDDGRVLLEETIRLSPNETFKKTFDSPVKDRGPLTVTVSYRGKVLVSYRQLYRKSSKLPSPAPDALPPAQIRTNEELYLMGLHLEQYRHATYRPDQYYEEGLKRDPGDSRINNAYGRLQLSRGRFKDARKYFRKAIGRLTWRNPNPYDTEAYRNLGLADLFLSDDKEAFDSFYKSTWDDDHAGEGYYYLALVCARHGNFAQGLDFIERSLDCNARDQRSRGLHLYLLRKNDCKGRAKSVAAANLQANAFDFTSLNERYLLEGAGQTVSQMQNCHQDHMTAVRQYLAFGAYEEALELLQQDRSGSPMRGYYMSYILGRLGKQDDALAYADKAEMADSAYCFPNDLMDIPVLRFAMDLLRAHRGKAPKAAYYLGCLYYDKYQYDEAVNFWEQSREDDPEFPTVHRNLALAYFNKRGLKEQALVSMEQAFALDRSDARVLLELDQLRRKMGWTYKERLAELERYPALIGQRDDLLVEYLTALNLTGGYEHAYTIMLDHHFHPWEGGEGKVTTQYRISLMLMAKDAMTAGDWSKAIGLLTRALSYPSNLGEGKIEGQKDCDIHYFLGMAQEASGHHHKAQEEFRLATLGSGQVTGARYYNDQPAQMVLYQGLAYEALGDQAKANAAFYRLLDYGEQHLDDRVHPDYFAVSLPDFLIFDTDETAMNHTHCLFLIALGQLGLGRFRKAGDLFDKVLGYDCSHVQANIFHDDIHERGFLESLQRKLPVTSGALEPGLAESEQ